MGLFDVDPICRFCGMETETVQHIICCCEALARQRYYVFGRPIVEPKDFNTASTRDLLCLFIQDAGLLWLCWGLHNRPKAAVHKLTGPKKKKKKKKLPSDMAHGVSCYILTFRRIIFSLF